MAGMAAVFDPISEDATNAPLDVSDGVKFRMIEFKAPPPPRHVTWASSAATDGAKPSNLGYDNRTLTYVGRVYGSSDADFLNQLNLLEQKIGKIDEKGGTVQLTTQSGRTCVFDAFEGEVDYTIDNAALANRRVTVTVTMTAEPFWRDGLANEVAGTDHVETSLPVVIGVDTAIGGAVPAIGRLVIDDDQGQDRWTAIWGTRAEFYDSSADAAPFYQAETREPLGSAAKATLSGSSGSSENNAVLQGALAGTYQAMLSTQAAAGGNHLRHVGTYRVLARLFRPNANGGQVSVRLEWGEGDLRLRTLNDEVVYEPGEREGAFTIANLGLVDLKKAPVGAQRWEGRLLAKSTLAGDDLYCDWLLFMPVKEGYGSVKTKPSADNPTSFKAREEFDLQTAGNLDEPKTLPVGGNWLEANKTGANGFVIDVETHRAKRAITTDADLDSGCFAVANGVTAYGTQVVQTDFRIHVSGPPKPAWPKVLVQDGVLARYASTSNYVKATYEPEIHRLMITKCVAGKKEPLQAIDVGLIALDTSYTIRCMIDAGGRYFVWMALAGTALGLPTIIGQDPDLAAGGALATGKPGIYDACAPTGLLTPTRYIDNFAAWVPPTDAALFANQSLEIRSDRAIREDSSGTVYARPNGRRGSYFKPPPARMENRSLQTIVFLSRNNIDTMTDTAIDDASFRIFWQGRGLMLPGG